MGGAIAPGIGISAEMLSNRAAQLPEVAIKKHNILLVKILLKVSIRGCLWLYWFNRETD